MINFFVKHDYTVRPFLLHWPNKVERFFRIIPYKNLARIRTVQPGTYLFSDLERLLPQELRQVEKFCDLIASELSPELIINRPKGLLRRYELLRLLSHRGINHFRTFPFDHPGKEIRYPAFLRLANDHNGPLTGLLNTPEDHRQALKKAVAESKNPKEIITTEFCDTCGSDGLYRKFSAFRIGDRIIPGHIIFSTDWVTKDRDPEPLRDEERDYLTCNPHRDRLMHIFECAGIAYGRIDYGLREGNIQVWEINTNPMIIQTAEKYSAEKMPFKQQLVDQLSDAFLELHQQAEPFVAREIPVPLQVFHDSGIRRLHHHLLRRFAGLRL